MQMKGFAMKKSLLLLLLYLFIVIVLTMPLVIDRSTVDDITIMMEEPKGELRNCQPQDPADVPQEFLEFEEKDIPKGRFPSSYWGIQTKL